jgi:hypothetical protein
MTAFVDVQRDAYRGDPTCAMPPIVPSTYYEDKARLSDSSHLSERARRHAVLCEEIERVWYDSRRVYGARKGWR